jgi:PadR family transcriptional regulator AphA
MVVRVVPKPLTQTSYVVLALVERLAPASAYDLKRVAHSSVFNFWALPHSVLYSETTRLEAAGLLRSEQDDGGRRRRSFSLSEAGSEALDAWRREPTSEFLELRDPGLLQLFAGADAKAVAELQLRRHRHQLETYEAMLHDLDASLTTGTRLALEAGIGIEREYLRFWGEVALEGDAARPSHTTTRT